MYSQWSSQKSASLFLKNPQKNQWRRRRENGIYWSKCLRWFRFHLASGLKTSLTNGVVEHREDLGAWIFDALGFGVNFLGETASETLEFPVASDSCAWIGISRNIQEVTVTAIPCDAGVGLTDCIPLSRSSDRISLNNYNGIIGSESTTMITRWSLACLVSGVKSLTIDQIIVYYHTLLGWMI